VGKKIDKVHADFAIFNGPSRDRNDVLLIIEAKSSNMDITSHHISQARSYARELFPAHYIVTNGRTIKVFSFNGMKNAQDSQVMNIDKSTLRENWKDLHRCASKKATLKAKRER
jgi:hypothetical protein